MDDTNRTGFDVDLALKELEEINSRLARNEIPLSEAVLLYKRGVELAEKCREHLKGVEQELMVLEPDPEEEGDR